MTGPLSRKLHKHTFIQNAMYNYKNLLNPFPSPEDGGQCYPLGVHGLQVKDHELNTSKAVDVYFKGFVDG
jgi:hypothetical protein